MNPFLELYERLYYMRGWNLEIYHSSIVEWNIRIGYKSACIKHGEYVIQVEGAVDMDYAFAKAEVLLKDWLMENEGGY